MKKKTKQEQQDARTEVSEVATNVLRMELPISMPGLGHVNCYALIDNEGAAVVDPGLPGPDTRAAFCQRLGQAGLRETDVHTVIVTHSHPDHFGGARWLADEADARIVAFGSFGWGMGVAGHDHPEVSVDDLGTPHESDDACPAARDREHLDLGERWRQRRGRPSPWGGSPLGPPKLDGKESRVAQLMMEEEFFPEISDPIAHGDVLRLGGREWFVHHTPGHTSDHVCLHSPEEGLFLSGDHVLPSITPHISGTGAEDDPLEAYMTSLDDVARLEHVDRVLPAHGNPFDDLAARTEAIKEHHRERLDRIRKIAAEIGTASVVAFSRQLFPERSWGMMAESETFAHLEHMRHAGEAESHREGGELVYVIR